MKGKVVGTSKIPEYFLIRADKAGVSIAFYVACILWHYIPSTSLSINDIMKNWASESFSLGREVPLVDFNWLLSPLGT